ncbi:respiratory nitrate reductase subunit gamma [Streptomyces sp. RFCAC02]|uniref:respiratory nitrate reductase subunit gamma n=1 Tax=Streptomyces sp. RFCAC02 TaxID=2499143 RepID=UPI001F0E2225|nr:respiratory nitrate reductase subunit gamma [Streptomyces sp. RFCAC02]
MTLTPTDVFLWGALPYLAVGLLITGTVWRFRYDRFGWTTRSSELYESRLLRVGSPLFHCGLLLVVAGHVIGLLIPESWTDAAGLGEDGYHIMALTLGIAAGVMTLGGIALLIWRRRTRGPVFLATTRNDKLMYVVLVAALVTGLLTTFLNASGTGAAGDYDYRGSVSPWVRSLFLLAPEADLMADAPLAYRAHALVAFALIAVFPYTRLVHAFSAPVGYLFRPYMVYRSRAATAGDPGRRATTRAGAPR